MRDAYIKITVITPNDVQTAYAIYPSTITDEELNSIADKCLKEKIHSLKLKWYLNIKTVEITKKDLEESAAINKNSSVKWDRLTDEQVREANLQGVEWIGKKYIDT